MLSRAFRGKAPVGCPRHAPCRLGGSAHLARLAARCRLLHLSSSAIQVSANVQRDRPVPLRRIPPEACPLQPVSICLTAATAPFSTIMTPFRQDHCRSYAPGTPNRTIKPSHRHFVCPHFVLSVPMGACHFCGDLDCRQNRVIEKSGDQGVRLGVDGILGGTALSTYRLSTH